MNFTFKYWNVDGTLATITDYIVGDSITIARRCDEAFASGNTQAIIPAKRTNIPPYTLCEIDNEKYLMQSECTLYQPYSTSTLEKYVHDITITELTAVLECFIVGTKVLSSNEFDNVKMQKLCTLMATKYGVTFTLNTTTINNDTKPIESAKNEYRFANGTTLYDALTQIAMRSNCRPVVTDYTYNSSTKNITIGFIELSSFFISGTIVGTNIPLYGINVYELHKDKIIGWTKTQSQDNYCKYLETEANNVIDTTNLMFDKCLTERCIGETRLTLDDNGNGKIYTTAKINKVTKFEVNTAIVPSINSLGGADFFFKNFGAGISASHDYSYNAGLNGAVDTLYMWCVQTARDGESVSQCALYQLVLAWCNSAGANIDDILYQEWKVSTAGNYTFEKDGVTYTDWQFNMVFNNNMFYIKSEPVDVTNRVLEKDQYFAEAEVDRPKYLYYEQGTNVIDGLHLVINNDIWTAIASYFSGAFRGPFMPDVPTQFLPTPSTITQTGAGWYTGHTYNMSGTLAVNENTASYNVEYEAITNPMLMNIKTDTPSNESSYKNFGRTYNVGASQIDFDKLVDSMNMSNNMLGKVEHTVELLVDDVTLPSELTYNYLLTAEVKYTDTDQSITNESLGYILNYEIKYNVGYKSIVLYITSSVQNIANAIGIPYQYHATRLPIDNIVERPIRSKITMSTSNKNAIINNAGKLLVLFKFKDALNVVRSVVSRGVVLAKGDKVYLYCEAEDQYAFGYYARTLSNFEVVNEPVIYADENNEIVSYSCKIGLIEPSIEQSNNMPNATLFNENDFTITGVSNQTIYKDAYEKLTFTIDIE